MLHVLRLAIPNIYLLTGARDILIDAGGPKDVPRILSFLEKHGSGPGKLALILVTHGHWDHAGGAAQLKSATGAPIAIHRADADRARRGVNGPLRPIKLTGHFIRMFLDRSYPPFEPDLLIDEEIDLSPFGACARILFTPGHTPGSLSVRTSEGEIIVGDLLFGGWLGGWLLPTRPGLHYVGEDVAQIHASIKKVLAAAPSVIHPGHGGPLDPLDVARQFS